MINWDFLKTFNATGFKGWSVGWLWIWTFTVWAICAVIISLNGKDAPVEWLAAWLTGLCTYSGVSAYQFTKQRQTDWELNRIKTGTSAAAPSSPKDGAA